MKPKLSYLFLLIALISIKATCTKDAPDKNAEPYVISPQKIINMAGKNWPEVQPELSDKKAYWYTELNNGSGIKAAVSLQAIDSAFPQVYYYMLLNVVQTTERLSSVGIYTIDSLHHLSKEEAYNLMLFYYNNGLATFTDTTYATGNYGGADGHQYTTTANDVLEKIKNGYDSFLLSISVTSRSRGGFSITLWKMSDQDPYEFSFTN